MRHRCVAAGALDVNVDHVGGGEQGPGPPADHPMRRVGHDVEGKGGVGGGFQQAIIQHEARAVVAFLAGLEHEQDLAGELVAAGTEQFRCARQHRHMAVMPAGMHRAGDGGGVCEAGFLRHWQGVGVAAQ